MYFVQGNGGSAEDSFLSVNHLRYNNGGPSVELNNASWQPFQFGAAPSFPICTAIFTDGHWGFSGGTLA